MRKVLEITFAGPDFRVVTANSPDAALQKLKTDKPDLVITDLSLEPNGYELCKAIKKASPGTPRHRPLVQAERVRRGQGISGRRPTITWTSRSTRSR